MDFDCLAVFQQRRRPSLLQVRICEGTVFLQFNRYQGGDVQ
jgi:hypothetical protein